MALIVGLPLHQDGTEYELSKRAQKFGRRLQGRFNLPVYWVDERLSTYAAKQQPSLEDHRPHKVSNWDALAAKFILESWMAQNVDET